LSVGAVILESVPRCAQIYGPVFQAIEFFAVGAFTLEYALRIWTAPEHTLYSRLTHSFSLAFIHSGSAVIDLFAILPAYLSVFLGADLRILLLLRLLRFFKLARYSRASDLSSRCFRRNAGRCSLPRSSCLASCSSPPPPCMSRSMRSARVFRIDPGFDVVGYPTIATVVMAT